jgi:cell division protease FtsH
MDNKSQKGKQPENKPRTGFPIPTIIIFAVLVLITSLSIFPYKTLYTKQISWQEFNRDLLSANDVKKLEVINQEDVYVYLKPEVLGSDKFKTLRQKDPNVPQYVFKIGNVEAFERKLDEAQKAIPENQKVEVVYTKKSNWLIDALPWILPAILFIFFWRYIISRSAMFNSESGNSIFNFGKSSAQIIEKKTGGPTFKDVAGYNEAKTEVMEIVDFLKNPGSFTKLGAKIPKGVLLIGPPGTGKTLMAKAVAGEAGVPFYSLAGSEFVEMFVGVGASRVRDLFRKAKETAPCIIFIDELDTVGRTREKAASFRLNDERESTLNQLLAEMDGFDSDSRIVVLAATNRADILDPALVRAGRFDRHIYLELPNKSEREDIFKVHMRALKYDSQKVNAESLASQTPGFSGADIANVCNEAALIAARQRKELVEMKDFTDAIEKVIGGLEKKSVIISEKEKKIVAYHEAGHAMVSWLLPNIDPIIKLSIIPRGKSLGSTWFLPGERKIISKAEFEDNLCASLGGRAAEEIVFNEVSSGAMDDLEKVTKTAYSMVMHMGFDKKLGNISYYDSSGMNETSLVKPYSEQTAQLIDEEVRELVQNSYEKTKHLLIENRNKLENLAHLLMQKETLNREEIEKALGKKMATPEPVIEEIH